MGWWSDFTGKTGADAARAAAADTYSKQQSAIARLLGYGDELKSAYDNIGASYQPYVNSANRLAGTSDEALNNLIQNPDSVRALPSYQFDQQEGQRAIDRSAAARGMDASGRTLKDLTRFGTGLADQTYGNQLTRLLGIDQQGFSQGMQALGAQNGAYGAGLQGQYGARATAYNGDMASAGTIGQGDIAAANARAAGSQNIFNGAMKLGGLALGAFGIPGAAGGSALGSLMSGSRGSSYVPNYQGGPDSNGQLIYGPGY
jgi:hypothetical protein